MNYQLWQYSLFQDLSPEELKNIEDFCQEKILETGEILFHEGDEPQALYIIASGSLSVLKNNSKEVVVLESGSLLGEMAFFGNETKRNATLKAREETHLIVLLAFSLVQLFWKYPQLQEKLTQLIQAREAYNSDKNIS